MMERLGTLSGDINVREKSGKRLARRNRTSPFRLMASNNAGGLPSVGGEFWSLRVVLVSGRNSSFDDFEEVGKNKRSRKR